MVEQFPLCLTSTPSFRSQSQVNCSSSIRVKIGSRQLRNTTRVVTGRTAWEIAVGNCRGKVPGNGTTRAIGSVHRKECNASFSGPLWGERCVTATRETYFSLSGVTNNLCTTLFKASLALAGSLRNSSVDLALASSRCIRQLEPPSEEGYC